MHSARKSGQNVLAAARSLCIHPTEGIAAAPVEAVEDAAHAGPRCLGRRHIRLPADLGVDSNLWLSQRLSRSLHARPGSRQTLGPKKSLIRQGEKGELAGCVAMRPHLGERVGAAEGHDQRCRRRRRHPYDVRHVARRLAGVRGHTVEAAECQAPPASASELVARFCRGCSESALLRSSA